MRPAAMSRNTYYKKASKMRPPRRWTRAGHIGSVRSALERDHWPRLQMMLIVMLTGLAGLLSSFLMLHAGVMSIGMRYFFAMCSAYIMFLFLLWIWMRTRADDFDIPDPIELADLAVDMPKPDVASFSGHGGSFDGGGASGDYLDSDAVTSVAQVVEDAGDGVGDALGSVAGADDAAIPIAVVLLGLAILFSSLFVVYSAPVLFAELLVDGVLTAGLYNRLRNVDRRHWLETALRRTALPFVLTAAVVTGAGFWMGSYAPGAHSLGEVLRYVPPPEASDK
jgi:hypothetical protein